MIDHIAELIASFIGGNSSYHNFKCPHCGKIAFLVVVAVVAVVVYYWPVWQTEEVVSEEAQWLCHGKQGNHPGEKHPMKMDAWNATLQYHTEESEDPIATICTVTSAGRDGKFGTNDDIIGENINYHKTKIISKWAGSKVKDAVSGFTEGVKESLTVE